MKRLLILILLVIATIAGTLLWWAKNTEAPSKKASYVDLVIAKGSSATLAANKLQAAGLIKNALAFRIYVQVTSQSQKIPSGEYRLSTNLSLFKIVEELLKGPTGVWVTIPEGLRREEIAQTFTQALGEDSNFTDEFMSLTKDKEGYLFPDTYLFLKVASASAVVDKMQATFDIRVDENMRKAVADSGRTLGETVNLASLIERETRTDEERPIVAGILLKRLKAGMPLQLDATIQYVVASSQCTVQNTKCEWWPETTIDDRLISSPFNTYKYAGLPPAPIANPGLSSIRAAIYPQDSPYWYYLHDDKGQIHYAKTLEEHNANVIKFIEK